MSSLESLSKWTTVVADTGDFDSIDIYHPTDATTNPSLIKQATAIPKYEGLLKEAINFGKSLSSNDPVSDVMDKLSILFGVEILKKIPGRVSTEVDASLSFDINGTIEKAKKLISLYAEHGISKERVLIKVSSTWEGIQAAKVLESEYGIHCNLTLLFSMAQAIAAGNAGVTLISPFVGRIYDWFSKRNPGVTYEALEDPGVVSVRNIYNYFKKHGIKTTVMGASFRNSGQIKALCGCDALTIAPKFLEELKNSPELVEPQLTVSKAMEMDIPFFDLGEKTFRWMMNEDEMASDKLAEGIRLFHQDSMKLRETISKLMNMK